MRVLHFSRSLKIMVLENKIEITIFLFTLTLQNIYTLASCKCVSKI